MRRLIVLFFIINGLSGTIYSQIDFNYGWAAQQMLMQNQMDINNMMNQMLNFANEQHKEFENNMGVLTYILPAGADLYNACVMVSYPAGINKLKFMYTDNISVDNTITYNVYGSNDLLISGQYVLLPADLKPGYTLRIAKKEGDDYKVLAEENIPNKDTHQYRAFQDKANGNVSFLSSMLGGGNNQYSGSYNNNSYSSGTRSREEIRRDMSNTQQRINQNKTTLETLGATSTLRPTYNRMIIDDENRMQELERELNRVSY